jgi:hypothetical protein
VVVLGRDDRPEPTGVVGGWAGQMLIQPWLSHLSHLAPLHHGQTPGMTVRMTCRNAVRMGGFTSAVVRGVRAVALGRDDHPKALLLYLV